jgi:hypothetical protein
MTMPFMDELTRSFFDQFVVAFRTFDGREIARRYHAPYLALHENGSIDCFVAHADIARYFQDVVDGYYRQGCRSCRYRDLGVVALGRRSALATVTWDLLEEDGNVLTSWRESYNLTLVDEGSLRVIASVDHVA